MTKLKPALCYIPLLVNREKLTSITLSIESSLEDAIKFIQIHQEKYKAGYLTWDEAQTMFYFINEVDGNTYDGKNVLTLRIYDGLGKVMQDFKLWENLLEKLTKT